MENACKISTLITKSNKNGEVPYVVDVNNDKDRLIPDKKGSTSYYRYNVPVIGEIKDDTKYLFLIYYEQEYGGFTPIRFYTNKVDADKYLNYWNDDEGIIATGHYYFMSKVKILK